MTYRSVFVSIVLIFFVRSAAACGGGEFRLGAAPEDAAADVLVQTGDVDGESSAEDGGRLPGNDAALVSDADGWIAIDASVELETQGDAAERDASIDVDLLGDSSPRPDVTVPCSPATCAGCCLGALPCGSSTCGGVCVPGNDVTACGYGGGACYQCTPAYTMCLLPAHICGY